MIRQRDVIAAHNVARGFNQPSLSNSPGLHRSADAVAHRLAKRDQGISHSKTWWKIIDRMTKLRFGAKGENLAVGFASLGWLMDAWMHSPLHRKNIMNPDFTKIGVGIATGRSGQVYVVTHFGGK